MDEIMVSVVCLVYNHEKYLRKTLDGFVSQKTDFKFEVIVHDDASTDRSAEIIHEYEAKYPQIIKAICQTENKFSRHIKIYDNYIWPIVRGKYYAPCEGDDCWIDEFKLAKQVAYMESHPDCTFCFTNAIIKNAQNGMTRQFIPYKASDAQFLTESGEYNMGQLSMLSFIPYASFMLPMSNRSRYPDDFNIFCWAGDRKTSLYATGLGYAYFLNEPTCCYNYGVSDSAMTKNKSKNQVAEIERSIVDLNYRLDRFSDHMYSECFRLQNLTLLRNIMMLAGDEMISEEEIDEVLQNDTPKEKLKRFVVQHMSDRMFNTLRALKRKLSI